MPHLARLYEQDMICTSRARRTGRNPRRRPCPLRGGFSILKAIASFGLFSHKTRKTSPEMPFGSTRRVKRECYFYYSDGAISVKDPDERIIAKMQKVALSLKAKVGGDD